MNSLWARSRCPTTRYIESMSRGLQGVAQRRSQEHSPPLQAGVDATSIKYREVSRSLLYGADGVVIKFDRILLRLNTTPSARAKEASQLFVDRAATPPRRGGESNSPLSPRGN